MDGSLATLSWKRLNPVKKKYMEKKIIWYSTQPMFAYIERPVMLFIDYLCYCGGLISLCFGFDAKTVIVWFIEQIVWQKIKLISSQFK